MVPFNAQLDPSVSSLVSILTSASGTAVLAFVTVAWLRGWIVTRREFDGSETRCDQLRQERDEWRDVALRALNNSERLQGTAEQAVNVIAHAAKRKVSP